LIVFFSLISLLQVSGKGSDEFALHACASLAKKKRVPNQAQNHERGRRACSSSRKGG